MNVTSDIILSALCINEAMIKSLNSDCEKLQSNIFVALLTVFVQKKILNEAKKKLEVQNSLLFMYTANLKT